MANKGRRMVFEEDIKKIGEGGGKPSINDFEAGYGIVIDEDLSNDKIVVMTDDEAVAYKSEVTAEITAAKETVIKECSCILKNASDFEVAVDAKSIPLLSTDQTAPEGYTNVIEVEPGEYVMVQGAFGIVGQAGIEYYYTASLTTASANKYRKMLVKKVANRGFVVEQARLRGTYSYTREVEGVEVTDTITSLDLTNNGDINIDGGSANKPYHYIAGLCLPIKLPFPVGDVRYDQQIQIPVTTDGTYVLKATVLNGAVTLAWVLEV